MSLDTTGKHTMSHFQYLIRSKSPAEQCGTHPFLIGSNCNFNSQRAHMGNERETRNFEIVSMIRPVLTEVVVCKDLYL